MNLRGFFKPPIREDFSRKLKLFSKKPIFDSTLWEDMEMIGILFFLSFSLIILACDYHVMKELRLIMALSAILIAIITWQHISFMNNHLKQKEVNREGSRNIIG